MSEGTQYLGMTADQIAAHDYRCEHGFARLVPQGAFSIGGTLWPGLSKLIEECGEVLQIAGKLIGSEGKTDHWSGDLRPMLIEELGDLAAAMEFFATINGLDIDALDARREKKLDMFERWHRDTLAARTERQGGAS